MTTDQTYLNLWAQHLDFLPPHSSSNHWSQPFSLGKGVDQTNKKQWWWLGACVVMSKKTNSWRLHKQFHNVGILSMNVCWLHKQLHNIIYVFYFSNLVSSKVHVTCIYAGKVRKSVNAMASSSWVNLISQNWIIIKLKRWLRKHLKNKRNFALSPRSFSQ